MKAIVRWFCQVQRARAPNELNSLIHSLWWFLLLLYFTLQKANETLGSQERLLLMQEKTKFISKWNVEISFVVVVYFFLHHPLSSISSVIFILLLLEKYVFFFLLLLTFCCWPNNPMRMQLFKRIWSNQFFFFRFFHSFVCSFIGLFGIFCWIDYKIA